MAKDDYPEESTIMLMLDCPCLFYWDFIEELKLLLNNYSLDY